MWRDLSGGVAGLKPQELEYAIRLSQAAADLRAPVENPELFGFELIDEDGNIETVQFEDTPMTRAIVALKHDFKDEPEKFQAIVTRMSGLWKMIGDGALDDWINTVKSENGPAKLSEAVIWAVANEPMNIDGEFDHKKFVAVLQINSQM